MSAQYNMKTVPEILLALQTALVAATWTPAGGDPETAFQAVKIYGLNSLPNAIRELLISQQRICLIVPADERFEPLTEGQQFTLARTLPVALLISDRVLGDRQKALLGGEVAGQKNPGAYGLQQAALEAVAGQLIDNPAGVICTPTISSVVDVEDTEKKLPGRAVLELDLDCTGGLLRASLNPGYSL